MAAVLTLKDIYNRDEAFIHPDPLVRVTAIHHAGRRLAAERTEAGRKQLVALLADPDRFVARYAAVSLAQCCMREGIVSLVESLANGLDEELEACVRDCATFPFAALLVQRLDLSGLPLLAATKGPAERKTWDLIVNRSALPVGSSPAEGKLLEHLATILTLTAEEFYTHAEKQPAFRNEMLSLVGRLEGTTAVRGKTNIVLGRGRVLSVPTEKKPGYIGSGDAGLFLQFYDSALLNRDDLGRFREVLFVANTQDGATEVESVYVLADTPSDNARVIEQELFEKQALQRAYRDSPLIPGVVAHREKGDVDVLFGNGLYHLEKATPREVEPGSLALLQPNTEQGKQKCYFVTGVRVRADFNRAMIQDYAREQRLALGAIIGVGAPGQFPTSPRPCVVKVEGCDRPVQMRLSNPRIKAPVLARKCEPCKSSGAIPCNGCGGLGNVKCSGTHPCPTCDAKGQLPNGAECQDCAGKRTIVGCEELRSVACQKCSGNKTLICLTCNGAGNLTPQRGCTECGSTGLKQSDCSNCQGSGEHTADCYGCEGTGYREVTCRVCNGSGRKGYESCRNCTGSGIKQLDCNRCDATGTWRDTCRRCNGTGHFSQNCRGCGGKGFIAAVPCNDCYSKGAIRCFNCGGYGTRYCQVCRLIDRETGRRRGPSRGRLRCERCRGNSRLMCTGCRGQGWLLAHRIDMLG